MTNPYYDHTTFPTPNAPGSSAQLRAELDLIEAGFDKLPTLAGNANNLVTVKADESGLESVSSVSNLTLNNPTLNNAVLTGVPTTPTAAPGTSTTQVASTAFVAATAFSSALPAQTGNAGKFVTTDGTTASWADPWVGSEFTASGSITLGAAVALRTDGQVETVAESAGTFVGSTVSFDTNAAYLSGAYHVAQDKYVFVYADGDNSNYGTAVVATQVGSVLTFGTPVVFRSATTAHLSAAYDSVTQKIIIAYQDGGNSSYGTAIVGTVSGTTISFGAAQVFNAASTAFCSVTFDASAGRPVIAYQNTPNQYGYVIVGTVSGTAISFGGAAVNLPASSTTSSYMVAVYDSTNSKTVIFYRDVGNTLLRGVVGTVSGVTITLGSPEQLATNASWVSAAFVGSGKSVVAYQDASTNGAGVVASVSGTTLTFGTAANFIASTMAAATPAVVYDSASDRVVVQCSTASSIEVKVGTVSGTSISYGTAITVDAQSGGTVPYLAGTFNTAQGRVVFTFRQRNTTTTFGYIFSNKITNAYRFIGFAQNAATNGNLVKVATGGQTDANRSSLTANTTYYVNYNGTLLTSNTGYAIAGLALGTTKILVDSNTRTPVFAAYTGNSSYTVPANVRRVRVYAFGKGGNGDLPAGGGGGGCAYGDVAVTPGDQLFVNITATGVATVTYGATTLFTANAGTAASGTSAGSGGTASVHASVTNGGAYTGGAGASLVGGGQGGAGGGASGSPLGPGGSGGSVNGTSYSGGGGGWGGAGGNGGNIVGGGGGAGGAGANGSSTTYIPGGGGGAGGAGSTLFISTGKPGVGRQITQLFTDPLLAPLVSPGTAGQYFDTQYSLAYLFDAGPGGGGGGVFATLGSQGEAVGGGGGFGGGGGGCYLSATDGGAVGGAGGFGGGGGGSFHSARSVGGAGGFGGGGGGANSGATITKTGGAGGAAVVLIYA